MPDGQRRRAPHGTTGAGVALASEARRSEYRSAESAASGTNARLATPEPSRAVRPKPKRPAKRKSDRWRGAEEAIRHEAQYAGGGCGAILLLVAIALYVTHTHRGGPVQMGAPELCSDSTVVNRADRIVCRLPTGKAAFSAPRSMTRGEPTSITLAISRALSGQVLTTIVDSDSEPPPLPADTASIRMSSKMAARLEGQGFEITPSDAPIRLLTSSDTAVWQWQVTPRRSGDQLLVLTLLAYTELGPRPYTVLRRRIKVRVSWGDLFSDGTAWLERRWELAVFVAAVFTAAVAFARRRKRKPIGFRP